MRGHEGEREHIYSGSAQERVLSRCYHLLVITQGPYA